MKKGFNLFAIILIVMLNFMPFYHVEASSSYTVEMVSNSGGNEVVGSYGSYSDALKVMNNQNSSSTKVATIYKDGVPIDSKYAIFKLKPGGTFNLYRNSDSWNEYTSISSSYGIDAALLGYSENGRVKIMISGFTGWIDINSGVVTPISLLGSNLININGSGVRVRDNASTSTGKILTKITGNYNFSYTETTNNEGYKWYKISYNGIDGWVASGDWLKEIEDTSLETYYNNYSKTGNLIHHFTTYTGTAYSDDSFENLGTSPSYLDKDVKYYSFDSNYFYSSLTKMLDDYRSGSYNNSVNSNSPFYAYYVYLPSHSTTAYTADDLNSMITNTSSKLYGTGQYFIEAGKTYGSNAMMAFAAAINESSGGTSSLAINKNNLFGYGAADSCPYDCAYSYANVSDSITDYMKKTSGSYSTPDGAYYYGSHYGNKSSGRNVKYATDPYWGETQASISFSKDKKLGGKDFNYNTIGVTKKGVSNVWVFDKAEATNEAHIYTLKNSNSSDAVYDISVNVVDKITANGKTFYKIYTDLPSSANKLYGYVDASEINVSNSQPVISAFDKTINVGSSFNYMDGVSAYDSENGDLTSKITYDTNLDTNKAGSYEVTYTVTDNNNFHMSKTIKVNVTDNNTLTLDASDQEVKQYATFDYLNGVKATDTKDGDLTSKITYEKNVDTNKAGTYEVTYTVVNSNGKSVSKTIKVTVIPNEKPTIEASDKEIYLNDSFDVLKDVKASDKEDGDLTSKIVVSKNDVKSNVIGEYEVTYSVTDNNNQVTNKTIAVKVIPNSVPVINATDKTISTKDSFNPLDEITASDKEDGNLTGKIVVVKNEVKNEIGKYEVEYEVTDSNNQKTVKTIIVTVTDEKPVINASDKTVLLNSTFNPLDGVTASDKEDGNLTVKYNGVVDTSKVGDYSVTYSVTDSSKQTTTKTVKVTVIEKELKKVDGKFYLDYLKEVNNKLEIKGYNTIQGIDNNLNTIIKYELVLKNQNTGSEVTQELARLTDTNQMTIPINSVDGKNYKYSWFKSEINVDNIPAGDYTLYVRSISDDYYSESIVQNMLLNEQTSQYNTINKFVTITNDYMRNDIPVNFTVRDEQIGNKETSTDSNQYSYIEKIEMINDKFHIRGASYSVNLDMSSSANLTRKIIFQNVDSFKTYEYDLGYLNSGTFNIKLISPDDFGTLKQKAWYDKTFDISSLPKGKYAIYITNSSNIFDYGELSDVLFTDLNNAKATIDNKNFEFTLNENLRNRIELTVK